MSIESEIVEMLQNGELDEVRMRILKLEDNVKLESSTYNRKVLLDLVGRLKGFYNAYNISETPRISFKRPVEFEETRDELDRCKDKAHIKNINNEVVKLGNYIEVVIEDCCDTVFEYFECQRSVLLINVRNCKVFCRGQQIRVNGCENVDLIVHTSTGVALQDSKGIVVRGYGDNKDNRFMDVQDFSSPLSSSNFEVL